ncbi:adenylate cyclase [Klebsiella michiganensis]|uniref:Adenylate cyclase n=1 Tax=Klebsiella michiganensis TaxID=1134687 RepID=A0A7H4PHN7_9ENTR|nr:adenylate cyclase [Klebsiella michiganensis]
MMNSSIAAMQKRKRRFCTLSPACRHALVLFGGIVPRKATTLLRERLSEAEAALAEAETAQGGAFQRGDRQSQADAHRSVDKPRLASLPERSRRAENCRFV